MLLKNLGYQNIQVGPVIENVYCPALKTFQYLKDKTCPKYATHILESKPIWSDFLASLLSLKIFHDQIRMTDLSV